MKKITFILLALAVLYAAVVYGGVPQKMMQQGYQKCIGTDDNPQRITYCACVRDGMGAWSLRDYSNAAFQLVAYKSSGTPPAKIMDLSKACAAEVQR